jgi:hypothetical protein
MSYGGGVSKKELGVYISFPHRLMKEKSIPKLQRKHLAREETLKRWREWLEGPGKVLTEVGLPNEILQDEDHWMDFSQHGRLHMHASVLNFTVDDISLPNLRKILSFLENDYGDPSVFAYSQLYHRAKERLGIRSEGSSCSS